MPTLTDQQIEQMLNSAKFAAENAYRPYSRFPVGAAVLSSSGRIFAGCNVENASFGLTICAERAALFNMISAGEREVGFLLIYTPTPSPVSPCGACRQVLREFARSECVVLCRCDGHSEMRSTLGELLPASFGPDSLEK